ncbi:helix-turn-helix domain-containing protein [Apilactobacillus kunkeei]|uniref:Xre-like DNA-binding protein n=1 Tax=Apilactobacillus kunkeei TaxID=148814 RepID=A0A0M9DET1_9LACO|nr:RodZ domain-containing protein [Apilactobacillus kunkeei]KOY79363.1 Xre-like DNA-binding protein [Apilactobacillus kunkeei]
MQNNNGKQVEIGKSLHEARVAKGMSIDDIQKITKIQKHYLEAIEQGNFAELPGDFYVRAFIKQFADTVGVNGIELLNEHDDSLPDTQSEEYADEVSKDDVNSRVASRSREHRKDSFRKVIPTIGIIVAILVVVCGIWAVVVHTNSSSQTSISSSSVSVTGSSESGSSSSKADDKKKEDKKSTDTKTTIKEVSATKYNVTGQKENTVTIKATGRVWSSIMADNKTLFQGSQNSGDKKDVNLPADTKSVNISLGNTQSAKILVNGTELEYDKSTPLTTQITLEFSK